ncbi:diacylglycerol kinase family protein [Natrarchaeobius sp. A-rgal3]|uniref:diacylglycerol/lipid kinase family protein n=1 Tax=Natrarchaeobius versutus TaxID=1679078 RepID=UPI0035101ED4
MGINDRNEDRVLVCNPVSGGEDHAHDVVERAREHGFEMRRTEEPGDGKHLAREVASRFDVVAAAGGDGTVNEVVNGVRAADALESTTVAVVPVGTGNNFATNVGIEGIESGFEAIERGRRRWIDLGIANDRAFVNSCVGGVTAEASAETSSESKRELGVLAYVKSTFETLRSFDSLPLRVATAERASDELEQPWEGRALLVLVGNCRRFGPHRGGQANVEDGLFEVTIVEDAPSLGLVEEMAREGLFGHDAPHIARRRAQSLSIESLRSAVGYSLDGEILETDRLTLETKERAVRIVVGDGYRPNPDANPTD